MCGAYREPDCPCHADGQPWPPTNAAVAAVAAKATDTNNLQLAALLLVGFLWLAKRHGRVHR